MKVELENGLLKANGKYFELKNIRGKEVFQEIEKSKVTEKEKLVRELAKKLKDNLDREVVMREALRRVPSKELKKIDKLLKSKKKNYKPKTREGHCADMLIGNYILPVVD